MISKKFTSDKEKENRWKVNYEYFDSENDYSKNPNATKHR